MMNKLITLLAISLLVSPCLNAQDDELILANVCNKNDVVVYGDTQPWPNEGIMKIEAALNRDLQFLKKNPKFRGKVFIEHTINCHGQSANFNVIVPSEEGSLDRELMKLLNEIENWTAGTKNGVAVDSWYLWKFKVKKGKLTIIGKKQYY